MRPSRTAWWFLGSWVLLVGGYSVAAMFFRPGPGLTTFGDFAQCVVPLFANAGLLLNAGSPDWRRNGFWMLLALGCTLWLVGQLLWTYSELYLHQPAPNLIAGDIIFFLHSVPMMAALTLQPHRGRAERGLRFGYLDFSLLLLWWVYLYAFAVLPWQLVQPNAAIYAQSFTALHTMENLIIVAGLGVLFLGASGGWRTVYGHLCGAAGTYFLGTRLIDWAMHSNRYYTGSVYDVPVVASFVWFGTAGILAARLCPPAIAPLPEEAHIEAPPWRNEGLWTALLALAAVISMPVMALWSLLASGEPETVRHFRLMVTLVAAIPLSVLVFLRQHLLDGDRVRLLRASQQSIENLKRLQTQFVQAEKLASLGQLAAGAAHEINNPLTAILGFSDLMVDDPTIGEKPRSIAGKIREQARRTKTLVTHLLSFARQVPAERTLLDINAVVASAVQLRVLDLRGKNIQIQVQTEPLLPGVRGDSNQLLQVFFNIISNAVDALGEVGGGTLTVRTLRDRTTVVVEISDSGPGIKEPHLVFDPFYTTKPVGKGTGLGLSICYGLVQEHSGSITCYNRQEGGATFRVQLPAVLALFPGRETPPAREATREPGERPAALKSS